jgi:hypothetical protein
VSGKLRSAFCINIFCVRPKFNFEKLELQKFERRITDEEFVCLQMCYFQFVCVLWNYLYLSWFICGVLSITVHVLQCKVTGRLCYTQNYVINCGIRAFAVCRSVARQEISDFSVGYFIFIL